MCLRRRGGIGSSGCRGWRPPGAAAAWGADAGGGIEVCKEATGEPAAECNSHVIVFQDCILWLGLSSCRGGGGSMAPTATSRALPQQPAGGHRTGPPKQHTHC